MNMKAISLLEPWASLVAVGAKRIETRSWPTNYRGLLAIHASKSRRPMHMDLASGEPFRSALQPIRKVIEVRGENKIALRYHFGCVIAICRLVDCLYIGPTYLSEYYDGKTCGKKLPLPTGDELVFGNYTPGRFAWILKGVIRLPEPIPAKGWRRLWNWEVPEGVCLP
ncbi:MAG: hypothetical protein A4E56_00166 [Pelotomaculum sp. PtaU1.Bin065]|nr:MAG: hypothetical protein A4E56_00166 [Pelotomaculum sp. PtaU1.Bin065]